MYFGSQKREPCKNFYMVPNEIMRLGLSVGEIAVYNYLNILRGSQNLSVLSELQKNGRGVKSHPQDCYEVCEKS